MNDKLVSVIIPAYNAEKYIGACLDSVISQTYKNIEIVVVNDGSSDRTKEIIENYAEKDKRIKLISTENGGVSRARNIGIDNSKGEFFTFVDADDGLFENAVEILLDTMNETNGDIVTTTGVRAVFGEEISPPVSEKSVIRVFERKEAIECSLKDIGVSYAVWGKLYKKSVFKDIRFVEGRKIHEDSFFLFECFLKQPKLVFINSYVYRLNMTPNSASRAPFSEKFLDILYFADRKVELIKENFPELYDMTYNVRIKADMALLYNLCKTNDKKYKKYEKQCIKEIIELKKYFTPASNDNIRWFKIITLHFYPLYKIYYWFKYKRKQNETKQSN